MGVKCSPADVNDVGILAERIVQEQCSEAGGQMPGSEARGWADLANPNLR